MSDVPYERAIGLLDDEAQRARARRWVGLMRRSIGFWPEGGRVHLREHWVRTLVHALAIGQHEGLPDADLDALAAVAVFHDTRRKDPFLDVGHGERAAGHYRRFCEEGQLAFDERAFLAMAWHDRADEEGEAAIASWAASNGLDDDWTGRATLIYRIFKDADGLDRVRLGPSSLDVGFLRSPFARERVEVAWELLGLLPNPPAGERAPAGDATGQGQGEGQGRSTAVDRLYVQTLGQDLPSQDTDDMEGFLAKVVRLKELVDTADAIVVGIGSGMSTAAGLDFYHHTESFDRAFGPFEQAHGFATLFDGMYHVFASNGERWAFDAAVVRYVDGLATGQPYLDLASVLEGRDHFILTTNVDGQVPRAFPEDRIWCFQGDMRFLQCGQPCHGDVYDAVRWAEGVAAAEGNPLTLSYDDLPRCSECHRLMVPWVRDEHFLEGDLWQEQKRRYERFLDRHLARETGRVLFLEMGVSSMTPAIIKLPFWDMGARNPHTFYVDVNRADATVPLQLGGRAMVMTADIAHVTSTLATLDGTGCLDA